MIINATVLSIGPRSMLVREDGTGRQIVVNTRQAPAFRAGDRVRIRYNGRMTFSNPPQVSATSVVRVQQQQPPMSPAITSPITRARVVEVRRNALVVIPPQSNRQVTVNYAFARHFCVNQQVNVWFGSINLGNPLTVAATDITPVC